MGRVLPCSVEVLRCLLFILNVIFMLFGITLISIGIYIRINNNFSTILDRLADLSNFDEQSLGFLAFVLIGGGVFTVILAFVGCMGSLWLKRYLLYIYGIILAFLMILEIVGVSMAFSYKGKLEDVYKKGLYQVFSTALNNSDTKVLQVFHDLESSQKCCAVNGIDDYHGKDPNPDCFRYQRGCASVIIDLLKKSLPIIGGSLAAVLSLELFAIICAVAFAIALKNAPEDTYSSTPGKFLINIAQHHRTNYNKI